MTVTLIYKDVRNVFMVLAEFHVLDNNQLREPAQTLAETYSTNLEPIMFCDEMVQFFSLCQVPKLQNTSFSCCLMHKEDLHGAFPNVAIALRIYMCLMETDPSVRWS